MKRVKLPAALLALLLLLSGCQSGMEASSLTVVTGIGLDGLPGECRVSVEAIQLTQTQEGGQRVLLHADGVTLSDSILNTVAITGRRLHSNHAEVLVISRMTCCGRTNTPSPCSWPSPRAPRRRLCAPSLWWEISAA